MAAAARRGEEEQQAEQGLCGRAWGCATVAAKWVGIVLLAPLVLAVVVSWTVVSFVLGQHMVEMATLAAVLAVVPFVVCVSTVSAIGMGDPSPSGNGGGFLLLCLGAFALSTAVLLSTHTMRATLRQVIALLPTALICGLCGTGLAVCNNQQYANALICLLAAHSLNMVAYLHLWLGASPEGLEKAERELFRRKVSQPHAMAVIHGVGTVVVPWDPHTHGHLTEWAFPNTRHRPSVAAALRAAEDANGASTPTNGQDIANGVNLVLQTEQDNDSLPSASATAVAAIGRRRDGGRQEDSGMIPASTQEDLGQSPSAARRRRVTESPVEGGAEVSAVGGDVSVNSSADMATGADADGLDVAFLPQRAFNGHGGGDDCSTMSLPDMTKPVLVLLHGYAGGTGHFFMNLGHLAERFQVYALDMYGCGRSDRVPFRAKSFEEATEFFVSALERWRAAVGLHRFTLAGHSMGAIIVSSYAMQYAHRIEHLILLSPAGVGPPPRSRTRSSSVWWVIVRLIWEAGLSPMHVLRWAGPLGYKLTDWGLRARFGRLDANAAIHGEDLELFVRYCHQNYCLRSSGENALSLLLAPGAYSRNPIINWLEGGENGLQSPVSVIYGDPSQDWMDSASGAHLVDKLRQEGLDAEVYHVSSAGHLLFLEAVQGFAAAIFQAHDRASVSVPTSNK